MNRSLGQRRPRRRPLAGLFAGWLLLVFSAQALGEPTCVPVAGPPFAASLLSVDAQWSMRFRTGDVERSLSAADVMKWGLPVAPGGASQLVLADGGLLVATVKEADRERVTVDSPLFGELQVPLELLSGIIFQAPAGAERYDRLLASIRRAQGTTDRALFDNGDVLTGSVRAINTAQGEGAGALTIEGEVGPVVTPMTHLVAIVFHPGLVARLSVPGLHALVGFDDGSCLRAASLVLDATPGNEGTAWITLAGKLTWQASAKSVVFVQPTGGRARYLSQIDPVGYRQISYLETPGITWDLARGASVSGRQLRCRGQLYLEGIGMHSASRASYAIDPGDQRFEASIGIDDEAGSQGSVVFRVYVDSQQKYASPIVRGGEPPIPISVDVQGGKRLNLIVDFADRGDQLDRADWLDARLVR